jgi:predicted component of type VI protein secretion system
MNILTEQSKIDMLQILEDGQIQVRKATAILRDGLVVSTEYHRQVLEPGAENAQEILGDRFAIAQAAWTPEVIQAYQNKLGISKLTLSEDSIQ